MKELYDMVDKYTFFHQNIKFLRHIENANRYQEICNIVQAPFSRQGNYQITIYTPWTIDDVFHIFCMNGYTAGVKMLKGVGNRYIGFFAACEKGHYRIVKYLVKQGIDINYKDHWNDTAIVWAISGGHYKIVKLLIKYGADVHHIDDDGETYLYHVTCGNPMHDTLKIIQMLIDVGVDVNHKNNRGHTALDDARMYANYQVMKLLAKYTIIHT